MLVYAVDGLKNTVQHGINGFVFSGKDLDQQMDRFVRTTIDAATLGQSNPEKWQDKARQYIDTLYEHPFPPSLDRPSS